MNTLGERVPWDGSTATVTPEIAAEAAVWIARLHGPDRSPLMERECLAWQGLSAAHRLAFERCTDVWEDVPRVRLADAYASAAPCGEATGSAAQARSVRVRWPLAVLATVVVSAAVAVFMAGTGLPSNLWRDTEVYATQVGGQQLVVLDDGTRVSLNTATRVRVELKPDLRQVTVESGEALFEVERDPSRPFVVRVAGSEVLALGTVFSVRLSGSGELRTNALAVTLIEGQVSVRPAVEGRAGGIAPVKPVLMQAGERIRLIGSGNGSEAPAAQQLDRPRIEPLLAWKRSEAVFDDVSLAEAVAEMNRYHRTPIVLLGDASLFQLRVSGLYRTGDSAGFARAVAALHGLVVQEQGGRLELSSPH